MPLLVAPRIAKKNGFHMRQKRARCTQKICSAASTADPNVNHDVAAFFLLLPFRIAPVLHLFSVGFQTVSQLFPACVPLPCCCPA